MDNAGLPLAICTRHGNIVAATRPALELLTSFDVYSGRIPFELPRFLWEQVQRAAVGEASVWHAEGDDRSLGLSRYGYTEHLCLLVFKEISDVQSELSRRLQVERLSIIHRMTATVAHELRSPLGSIIYDLESLLARESSYSPEIFRETHKHMLGAAEKMKQTIEHFMSSAGQSHRDCLDLVEVCAQVKGLLRSRVRMGQHRLETNIAPEARKVYGDRLTVETILANLVSNALESSSGTAVDIEIQSKLCKDEHVQILVLDNGEGIDPSIASRIFDPFFTTKDAAAGMGLSTARDAAISLGGQLDVESQAPEGGAAFVLTLPRCHEVAS